MNIFTSTFITREVKATGQNSLSSLGLLDFGIGIMTDVFHMVGIDTVITHAKQSCEHFAVLVSTVPQGETTYGVKASSLTYVHFFKKPQDNLLRYDNITLWGQRFPQCRNVTHKSSTFKPRKVGIKTVWGLKIEPGVRKIINIITHVIKAVPVCTLKACLERGNAVLWPAFHGSLRLLPTSEGGFIHGREEKKDIDKCRKS